MNKDIIDEFVNYHKFIRFGKEQSYSETVKTNHAKFLNTFLKDKSIEYVKDTSNVKNEIEKMTSSLNLQKRYYGCLSSFSKYIGLKYNDTEYLELNKFYNNMFKETQKSIVTEPKPDLPVINYSDIVHKMPEENINDITAKIMLYYHFVFATPLRTDLITIKLRNYSDNDNYYLNGQFVFNCCLKTKRTIIQDLDEYFIGLVDKMITINSSDYLIVDSNGKPFNSKIYSNRLRFLTKKYFGQTLGINTARKNAISRELVKCNGNDGMKYEVADDLSRQMGNSVNTIFKYYSSSFEPVVQDEVQKMYFLTEQTTFNENDLNAVINAAANNSSIIQFNQYIKLF